MLNNKEKIESKIEALETTLRGWKRDKVDRSNRRSQIIQSIRKEIRKLKAELQSDIKIDFNAKRNIIIIGCGPSGFAQSAFKASDKIKEIISDNPNVRVVVDSKDLIGPPTKDVVFEYKARPEITPITISEFYEPDRNTYQSKREKNIRNKHFQKKHFKIK